MFNLDLTKKEKYIGMLNDWTSFKKNLKTSDQNSIEITYLKNTILPTLLKDFLISMSFKEIVFKEIEGTFEISRSDLKLNKITKKTPLLFVLTLIDWYGDFELVLSILSKVRRDKRTLKSYFAKNKFTTKNKYTLEMAIKDASHSIGKLHKNFNSQLNVNNFFIKNFFSLMTENESRDFLKELENNKQDQPIYNHSRNDLLSLLCKSWDKDENGVEHWINDIILIKIYSLIGIEAIYKNDYIKTKRFRVTANKEKKVAILIVGQFRGASTYEKLKKILDSTSHINNKKYYIYAWDQYNKYDNIFTSQAEDLDFNVRLPKEIKDVTPKIILKNKDFKKILPMTWSELTKKEIVDVDVERVKNIFSEYEYELKTFDESKIEMKYGDNADLKTRGGTLNQFKMFYLMHKCMSDILKEEKEFDYVLKLRPDLRYGIDGDKLNLSLFEKLKNDYMLGGYVKTVAIQDTEQLSTFENMKSIWYNIFELIITNKTFKILKTNNFDIKADSHKLLWMWYQNQNIFTKLVPILKRAPLFERDFSIPEIKKAFENDLKKADISEKDKESIKEFLTILNGKYYFE